MYENYVASVEDVWVIWLLSAFGLSILVFRSIRRAHWPNIRHFLADEKGASYALAYLMTFPFYLFFVCFVIQGSMILLVKIGVMHSAHVAVRSAVVWRSADPTGNSRKSLDLAKDKAQNAAAFTLAPFASGHDRHQRLIHWSGKTGRSLKARLGSYAYDKLYRTLAKQSDAHKSLAKSPFVRRKFVYASAMTDVRFKRHRNRFNRDLSVEVSHRMPVLIPLTGRIFGRYHLFAKGYYRDVTATATLPLETPESARGTLGIGYDPSRL